MRLACAAYGAFEISENVQAPTGRNRDECATKENWSRLKMRITRVYTRKGDKGKTGLVDGSRVSKASPRVEAYGDVDELNSYLGLIRSEQADPEIEDILRKVQNDL